MIDCTITMKELVEGEPCFGKFLVYKGFPFSLDNPIVEHVTFADVIELHNLNKGEFLKEYAEYKAENCD